MFGKGIIKLIGLMLAGAIALAGGAELLASVVRVVLAFRSGNPLPLLLVGVIAVILFRIVKTQSEETPLKMVLNIAAYASTGYLMVVAFVIMLPFGLLAAIVTAVTVSAVVSFIGNPSSLMNQIKEYIPTSLGGTIEDFSRRVVQIDNGSYFKVNSSNSVIVINSDHRNDVIELMRDRSLLPVSLTHYEDIDVLFVNTDRDPSMFERIAVLLKTYGIESREHAPSLLNEAVQMIPIIDEQNGLMMKEYRLARDEKTVQNLLSTWPVRMTVFPTEKGLMVLVPDFEVTGFNAEPLKQGCEIELVLHRNFTCIREGVDSVESTA